MYLEKIKLKISLLYDQNSWTSDQSILCHINYLIKEIVSSDIYSNEMINENLTSEKEKKIYLLKNLFEKFFNKKLTDLEPFINDSLIFLPENQKFIPLQRHDEEVINKIIASNDEQTIEDSYFFASVKQIELEKRLEKIFEIENKNQESFNEVLKFKENFREEFLNRYKYEARYLMDVYYYTHCKKQDNNCIGYNFINNNSNNYIKSEDAQYLINKIVY